MDSVRICGSGYYCVVVFWWKTKIDHVHQSVSFQKNCDYVPRAHDAGRGGGRIGEFFDRKAVDR